MMTIAIAGHVFGVTTRYETTRTLCREYLCDMDPEVVFSISNEELAAFDGQCPPSQREFYALHTKIASYLLEHDTLLFHGSCLSLDGAAILFTAPSGTGKSTHSRLWRNRFGERVAMINDDKPLLQLDRTTNQWTAWGTPWAGKESINTNTSAPLRAIVVLRQAPDNAIRRLSPAETTSRFLQQAFIPAADLVLKLKSVDLIGRLAQIPVYELGCTISQEAVDLSSALLTGK